MQIEKEITPENRKYTFVTLLRQLPGSIDCHKGDKMAIAILDSQLSLSAVFEFLNIQYNHQLVIRTEYKWVAVSA